MNCSSLFHELETEFREKIKTAPSSWWRNWRWTWTVPVIRLAGTFTPSSKKPKQIPTENLQSKGGVGFKFCLPCLRGKILKMPWRTWCVYRSQKTSLLNTQLLPADKSNFSASDRKTFQTKRGVIENMRVSCDKLPLVNTLIRSGKKDHDLCLFIDLNILNMY